MAVTATAQSLHKDRTPRGHIVSIDFLANDTTINGHCAEKPPLLLKGVVLLLFGSFVFKKHAQTKKKKKATGLMMASLCNEVLNLSYRSLCIFHGVIATT